MGTQYEVDKARGILRELVGGQVMLHPTADGSERFLTAELSGDYTGLVRLTVGTTVARYERKMAELSIRRRPLR